MKTSWRRSYALRVCSGIIGASLIQLTDSQLNAEADSGRIVRPVLNPIGVNRSDRSSAAHMRS
jgi:hypothetical protein